MICFLQCPLLFILNPLRLLSFAPLLAMASSPSLFVTLLELFSSFTVVIELIPETFFHFLKVMTLLFTLLMLEVLLPPNVVPLHLLIFFRKPLKLDIVLLAKIGDGLGPLKIVHLLAFVVLMEALVCAQELRLVGVDTMSNAVQCLSVDLVQDVLMVSLSEHVSVVATTLSQSQESNYQSRGLF